MTTAVLAPLAFTDVTDRLGPAERRFFGEGYKRAEHRLYGLRPTGGAEDATIEGTASVSYPADWSRKGGVDQQPHLSTVDAVLLAVQLAEAHLAHHAGLDDPQRRAAWVRAIRIRAGARPVEDLAAFPVSVRRSEVRDVPFEPRRRVSVLECTVGTMRAQVEIDHPVPSGRRSELDGLLRPQWNRPYGQAYRARRQYVERVRVMPARTRATARLRLDTWGAATVPGTGIEGWYQPSAGLIDAFVTALQLGQVMLYELDGMDREDSNTLWMRAASIEADTPHRPVTDTLPTAAELAGPALVRLRGTETWRRAEIKGQLPGIRVSCSVAHQLPEGHPAVV